MKEEKEMKDFALRIRFKCQILRPALIAVPISILALIFPLTHLHSATFAAQDKLAALGTAGIVTNPDLAVKGFSIFGSTNVLTYISTAPGNAVFNGAVQVSSDVYVSGISTFTGKAFFISTITVSTILGLQAPSTGGSAVTKDYVDAAIAAATVDHCALALATANDIIAGKTADINCDNLAEMGTMPTLTLNSANDTVAVGYYAATTLSAVDTDLAAGNITGGINIFGKTGTYLGSYPLVDTAQTASYTATFGEDHDYQPAAVQPSYTNNGNGTTTDNITRLMWANNGSGSGCNNGIALTWEAALAYCEGLSLAGNGDWRLPNIRELESIVAYTGANPSINATYFPNTSSSYYWSSTTYVPASANALTITYSSPLLSTLGKTATTAVRCVRAGP